MRIAVRLFVLMLLATTAQAQSIAGGVKGGLSVAGLPSSGEVVDQVVGHASRETSSRLGVAVGGYALFRIVNRIDFQPEVLFVMKGVKLDEVAGAGTVTVGVNYLDVPLLVRLRAPINSDTTVYILAGPNFGIKLATNLDGGGLTPSASLDPAINELDFGLAFGGGVERSRYFVEGRYTAGLTDAATAVHPHADTLRNRTVLVLAGIKLPLTR